MIDSMKVINSKSKLKTRKYYDVVLINPPAFHKTKSEERTELIENYWDSLELMGKQLGDQENEPNIGLLHIASALVNEGFNVKLLDFHMKDLYEKKKYKSLLFEDIIREITQYDFNYVGISCFTVNCRITMKIAQYLKKNCNCWIFLGGCYPTIASKRMLLDENSVDAVVRGEGEITVVEMLRNIDNLSKVDGLSFRGNNGDVIENPPRRLIENLDEIPYPNYSLLPSCPDDIVYRILTSRGCPFKCSFCFPKTFWRETVRYRNPRKVVDQIEYLVKGFGAKDILIGDLSFFENFEHAKGVCEEITKRNLKINWWCQTKASCVNKHVVKLLKNAGCKQVAIGIESTENTRKAINKEMSNSDIINALKLLKKEGITTQGYFIVGLPNEKVEDVMENVHYMEMLINKELLDLTCIAVLVPYPGLSVYEQEHNIEINIVSNDYDEYFMCVSRFCNPYPVYETRYLSRFQIRALWELAMATAAKCHRCIYDKKRFEGGNNMTEDVFIDDAGILGKGVFAKRDFAKDELILVIKGKVVELRDSSELSQYDQDHCFPVDWNKYTLPQPPWMYLNHSCNPNAGIRNNQEIVAMRPIARAEQITIDYAMNNNDEWTMECNYGESNCRRIIGGFDLLDAETKERYRGYVSTFIAGKYYKDEDSSDLEEETR